MNPAHLAQTYLKVREHTLALAAPLDGGGLLRAIHARCELDQVAPWPHQLVFLDLCA